MKILKDKQIIEDSRNHLKDDEELIDGDITLSLSRWIKEKSKFSRHNGDIGLRLSPSDNLSDIASELKQINLIALEFPAFTDGRSFSHARILRNRYAFNGEIRAMGNYMPDQVFYLSRVGVNAFELDNQEQLELALSTMNDFTVQYQSSTN